MATIPTDQNLVPFNDDMLLIPMSCYRGITSINKFGHNPSVAIGVEEEIWDGSVAYSYPATALITSMSQTTDQAAMRGETISIQGLDADWEPVTQTKTLDATLTTNVVTLDTPLIRVFRAQVLSSVVTDSPIRVHNAGETVDYAIMGTSNGQTHMAIYTVPAGRTAYMTNLEVTVNPATNLDPTANAVCVWSRDNANGYARHLTHIFGLTSGAHTATFNPYNRFTEKTDIYITARPTGKAVDVSASFDLIIVDEGTN